MQFVYSEEFIKIDKRLQFRTHLSIDHWSAIFRKWYSGLVKNIISAFISARSDFMGAKNPIVDVLKTQGGSEQHFSSVLLNGCDCMVLCSISFLFFRIFNKFKLH